VFFLLAKFGFPVITDMVDERSARIAQSLKDADEIQARMEQRYTIQIATIIVR
jgi:F0F1-type ATP synthase membrane subunit b/b'